VGRYPPGRACLQQIRSRAGGLPCKYLDPRVSAADRATAKHMGQILDEQ
jgi:hypothetical protein